MRPRRLALLLLGAALLAPCTGLRDDAPLRARSTPTVDVLLAHEDVVELSIEGPYRVQDGRGRLLARGSALESGVLQRDEETGLVLNGVHLPGQELVLRAEGEDFFRVGDRRYPGSLRARRDDRGGVELVNQVDMESYLAGVLFREMPASFPREALKAQAVAARSYARHRLGGRPLLPSDADQVYGGADTHFERARDIIRATRGEVLEIGGAPFPAYYSSTCGGATADGHRVFSIAPCPALRGTVCGHCNQSPYFQWSRSLGLGELAERLQLSEDRSIDRILCTRDGFGHALTFRVRAGEEEQDYPVLQFRALWNRDVARLDQRLLGTMVRDLRLRDGQLQVEGAGFGHSVGLCQYGAAGLAREGRSYRDILGYYYRDAAIVRRW